jgi:AraC family transcriptional activator of pobA
MDKIEKIEDLSKKKIDWIPESICRDIGHFNVFRLEPHAGDRAKQVPYMRPGFYKIILRIGNSKIHYSEKVVEVQKQFLVFSNPQIPCKWEYTGSILSGYYCIFSPDFFRQYQSFNQYEVFRPDGIYIFDLSEAQANKLTGFYEHMLKEIDSNYIYRYDVLRNLVFELVHFAMKSQHPISAVEHNSP